MANLPRISSDLARNRADLSRIRFRPFRIPTFQKTVRDLSETLRRSVQNSIPIAPDSDPSSRIRCRPVQNQMPDLPNPDVPQSHFDLSEKRGRPVQETIPIPPGSDLSRTRFRSFQKASRPVYNRIPIRSDSDLFIIRFRFSQEQG